MHMSINKKINDGEITRNISTSQDFYIEGNKICIYKKQKKDTIGIHVVCNLSSQNVHLSSQLKF